MQETNASAIPYHYWCMGAEERSRMEERKERKEYQHTQGLCSAHLSLVKRNDKATHVGLKRAMF